MNTSRRNSSSKPSSDRNDARDGQQGGQAGAVIGDAGTVQPAIRIDGDFFVVARRKHRIEMRGQGDVGAFAVLHRMGDHVAGAIDARDAAEGAELRQHPLGALLFEESGRGNAAELQLLFGDPLLVAGKALQGFANGGSVGRFR